MKEKKEFPKGTVILFLSFIALFIAIYLSMTSRKMVIPQELIAVLRPHATTLQPFTLTNKNAQPFTKQHLKDKWSFIFFGYTYCPDICPTTLTTLKHINRTLKKNHQAATDMQVIFVSVDPERDTPETLGKYTAYFSKDFIPVTGSTDELFNFSRQFSAAYSKEKTDTPSEYLMSHTSSIFLVDPKMRIVASFSPPHDTETITSQYLKIHDMFK